jgi:DNA repair protein RecO (recombination protein O)
MTLAPLQPEQRYALVPEGGLQHCHVEERAALQGAQWLQLQEALAESVPFTTTLRVVADLVQGLKPQLRKLLHYHCGVKTLRTRQMMIDLQAL